MRLRHFVICCFSVCTIFSTLSHKPHVFRKRRLLNIKCVFWFAVQLSSEIFLVLRRTERDMMGNCYILLTVYPNIMSLFFFYQPDAHILYFNTFIMFLYMFRALLCSSSGGQLCQYCIWYRHSLWVTVQYTGYERTSLIHKLIILIHLLYSSTCFEHYYAHPQEDNCISTTSGIVTLFRWLFSTQVTTARS